MSAVAVLEQEHALIERSLNILDAIAARLEQQQIGAIGHNIAAMMEFLRDFADQRHHVKEEDVLFPLMEQRGIPKAGGPIGCMLHEHEQGRTMIRIMDGLRADLDISDDQRRQFVHVARAYTDLMRNHIIKENTILFPMGLSALTPEDQQQIETAFALRDDEANGDPGYAHYLALIDDLSAQLLGDDA